MTIITEYNGKEVTEKQVEALAASILARLLEYYKMNSDEQGGDDKVA